MTAFVRYAHLLRYALALLAVISGYVAGLLFAVYGWSWMTFVEALGCLLVAVTAVLAALQASELAGIKATLRETEQALRATRRGRPSDRRTRRG